MGRPREDDARALAESWLAKEFPQTGGSALVRDSLTELIATDRARARDAVGSAPPKLHDKRHGGVLYVDMPVMAESTLQERAEICLAALARSEGLHPCDATGKGAPCSYPRCLVEGCAARRR